MELRGIEVKKLVWTPARIGKEGEETEPPKVTITLEMDASPLEVKHLLEFAQGGPTAWKIGEVKREMVAA